MILLNRIGMAVALIGVVAMLLRKKQWEPYQMWLALFMGGTAVIGVGQVVVNQLTGHASSSAWLGVLWTGFTALALFGALIEASYKPWRLALHVAQWAFILIWAGWCFQNPAIFSDSFLPHIPLTAIGMMLGAIALWTSVGTKDMGVFWLGATAMCAQGVDLIGYLALHGTLGMTLHDKQIFWTFRNGVWVIAYFLFLKALTCPHQLRSPSVSRS